MAGEKSTIGELLDATGGTIKTGPFGTKLKASEYTVSGVPVVSVGEVGFGRLRIHHNTPRVDESVSSRMPEFLLKVGDIVFGRKGAVERSAQIQPHEDGYFLGSEGIRIRLNAEKCEPKFISYQLQTTAHRNWMIQHAAGTTMPSLNEGIIRRIPIVIKPIAEQKAIASMMGTLDDKIEINRRMNETLEAMARALFKSWFVDFDPVHAKAAGRKPEGMDAQTAALFPNSFQDSPLGKIPKGWKHGVIRECCIAIQNGGTPRRDNLEFWTGGDIPWLTSGEVRQPIITATENTITKSGLSSSSAKWVGPFSTVVALYGATAGQVSLTAIRLPTNQAVYVYLDGIHLKRNWGGEVGNVAVLVAIAVNAEGYREVIGVAEGAKEDLESWRGFLKGLKERGLKGVQLFITDKCLGLVEALGEVFPQSQWQRCVVHFYRNVFTVEPRNRVKEVAAMLKAIHAQEDHKEAVSKAQAVAVKLEEMKLREAAKIVREGYLETLEYMNFPREHWLRIRTNNPLERIM